MWGKGYSIMDDTLIDALIDACTALIRIRDGKNNGIEEAVEALEGLSRIVSRLPSAEGKHLARRLHERAKRAEGDPDDPGLAGLLAGLPRGLGLEK